MRRVIRFIPRDAQRAVHFNKVAQKRVLIPLLQECRERGWLKERGKVRTDSTMILAQVRALASRKREITRQGYKVHLSENCDQESSIALLRKLYPV
jgi:hypothetical protein